MTLRIEVDGRSQTFDGSRALTIGRSTSSDIVLSAATVSRTHAELRPDDPSGDRWTLVDAGGQLGTFVADERISVRPLSGRTVVQCGPQAPGSSLTVIVEAAPAPPPAPDPAPPTQQWSVPEAPAPTSSSLGVTSNAAPAMPSVPAEFEAGFEPTYVLASSPAAAFPGAPPAPRTGPDLMVEAEGDEHRFRHPEPVTIGRLPESRVVISDPVASRAHLRVDPVPGGWTFTNLSREGTFLDGRRVESQRFEDAVALRLGHPTAGPAVTLVPVLSSAEEQARLARKRRARTLKLSGLGVGAVLLVLVLVLGSIALFGGGGGGAGPSPDVLTQAELNQAKSQTVLIYYNYTPPDTTDGSFYQFHGSGSIISDDGLILTNAHVVEPNAPGLSDQYAPEDETSPDPDYVTVRLTNPDDGYATDGAVYRASVVAVDGRLDGAVIQIDADADGNPIDPASLGLAHYSLGDSSAVQSGNPVTVLGFPGIAESQEDVAKSQPEVTVTSGVISTVIAGSGEAQPELDTDARIAPGNSGGSAIDDEGELIGVPSSVVTDQSGGASGRIRPINIYESLISQAEGSAN